MISSWNLDSLGAKYRLALFVGVAQGVVQLIGLASGLLIVRMLSQEQYAFYTIGVSAAAILQNIADGGVINGVMALGGKVWNDREKLGSVLASAMRLRGRTTAVVLITALPIFWLVLRHQGAGMAQAAAIILSMLPPFVFTLSTSLLETVSRLHQDIRPLQVNQLIANLARAAILAMFVTVWPLAAVALLAPALPQWWANRRLNHLVSTRAARGAAVDPEVLRSLVVYIRRTFPIATYYSLSGQITVWLASIFGRVSNVAAVGAMGRIAMVMTVLQSTFLLLAVPRFARIPDAQGRMVWSRYWQSQLLLALACAIPAGVVVAASSLVLQLLGRNYAGLEHELRLVIYGGAISTLTSAAFALGAARGIVVSPWAMIVPGILIQALLVFLLPMDTIAGVVWLGLLNAAFEWLLYVVYFRLRIRSATT